MVLGDEAWGRVQRNIRPILLMSNVLMHPGMNLTSSFARPQGKKEDRLKGKMFKRSLPKGLKRRFRELMKNQGKVPGRHTPPTFRLVPMETVQEPGKILILTNVYLAIPYFVGYSGPIATYGARLEMFFPEIGKQGNQRSAL